ncbi:hypothetical protein DES38_10197 [Streptohalobacillus salinus]|uniref:Uncharacterized protein n=1 Tax=Streptohalobacillus salinus TaxID=621096 RepID=A0A2V3WHG3_9BACI|nr:hypothetical protein [Streptohalobacillus salinus]PXW93017.1 hypothetical protein DES38_10197 [Streptohalobacillus salinus]
MIIIHKDKVEQTANDEALEMLSRMIAEITSTDNLIFSHLVIDDIEIYNGIEEFISENQTVINQIEIVTLLPEEISKDILISIRSYLERAIPAIENVITSNYGELTADFFQQVTDMSEGIDFINTFVENLKTINPLISDLLKEDLAKLIVSFKELVLALEQEDGILSYDILNYEIKSEFEKLQESVKLILKKQEGDDYAH